MKPRNTAPIDAMTLGNMRQNGVRRQIAYARAGYCARCGAGGPPQWHG